MKLPCSAARGSRQKLTEAELTHPADDSAGVNQLHLKSSPGNSNVECLYKQKASAGERRRRRRGAETVRNSSPASSSSVAKTSSTTRTAEARRGAERAREKDGVARDLRGKELRRRQPYLERGLRSPEDSEIGLKGSRRKGTDSRVIYTRKQGSLDSSPGFPRLQKGQAVPRSFQEKVCQRDCVLREVPEKENSSYTGYMKPRYGDPLFIKRSSAPRSSCKADIKFERKRCRPEFYKPGRKGIGTGHAYVRALEQPYWKQGNRNSDWQTIAARESSNPEGDNNDPEPMQIALEDPIPLSPDELMDCSICIAGSFESLPEL